MIGIQGNFNKVPIPFPQSIPPPNEEEIMEDQNIENIDGQDYITEVLNISKIKEGFYIGDKIAAISIEVIVQFKLTHMINASGNQIINQWETIGMKYLTLNWSEAPNQILFDPNDEIADKILFFIEDSCINGEGLLAHSFKGQNRVCIVVLIYLMKKYKWSLKKSMEYLKSKKQDVDIPPYFLSQLIKFESRLFQRGELTKDIPWSFEKLKDPEEKLLRNTYMNGLSVVNKQNRKDVNMNYNKPNNRHIIWSDFNPYNPIPISIIDLDKDLFFKQNIKPIFPHLEKKPLKPCIKINKINRKNNIEGIKENEEKNNKQYTINNNIINNLIKRNLINNNLTNKIISNNKNSRKEQNYENYNDENKNILNNNIPIKNGVINNIPNKNSILNKNYFINSNNDINMINNNQIKNNIKRNKDENQNKNQNNFIINSYNLIEDNNKKNFTDNTRNKSKNDFINNNKNNNINNQKEENINNINNYFINEVGTNKNNLNNNINNNENNLNINKNNNNFVYESMNIKKSSQNKNNNKKSSKNETNNINDKFVKKQDFEEIPPDINSKEFNNRPFNNNKDLKNNFKNILGDNHKQILGINNNSNNNFFFISQSNSSASNSDLNKVIKNGNGINSGNLITNLSNNSNEKRFKIINGSNINNYNRSNNLNNKINIKKNNNYYNIIENKNKAFDNIPNIQNIQNQFLVKTTPKNVNRDNNTKIDPILSNYNPIKKNNKNNRTINSNSKNKNYQNSENNENNINILNINNYNTSSNKPLNNFNPHLIKRKGTPTAGHQMIKINNINNNPVKIKNNLLINPKKPLTPDIEIKKSTNMANNNTNIGQKMNNTNNLFNYNFNKSVNLSNNSLHKNKSKKIKHNNNNQRPSTAPHKDKTSKEKNRTQNLHNIQENKKGINNYNKNILKLNHRPSSAGQGKNTHKNDYNIKYSYTSLNGNNIGKRMEIDFGSKHKNSFSKKRVASPQILVNNKVGLGNNGNNSKINIARYRVPSPMIKSNTLSGKNFVNNKNYMSYNMNKSASFNIK